MTFCLGLAVIVLASVALAMAVEKRFIFSDTKGELEKEIQIGKDELQFLRASLAQSSAQYDALGFGADDRVKRQLAVRAKRAALQEKRSKLQLRKSEAKAQIEGIKDQLDQHRSSYRKVTWQAAIGERFPVLKTRDGRAYLQAVIAKVTGSGLEVRHENGYASILADNLSDQWQDRFQWDRK